MNDLNKYIEHAEKHKNILDIKQESIKDFEQVFRKHMRELVAVVDKGDASDIYQSYCSGYLYSLISMMRHFGTFSNLDDLILYFREAFIPVALSTYSYVNNTLGEKKVENVSKIMDKPVEKLEGRRKDFFHITGRLND